MVDYVKMRKRKWFTQKIVVYFRGTCRLWLFFLNKKKIDFISAQELILESPLKRLNDNCLFLQFSVSFSCWFAFVFSDEKSKTDETVCNLLGVMYGYLIQGSILIPQYNSWFVCLKKILFLLRQYDNILPFLSTYYCHISKSYAEV